jgi:hypothetical protein
MPPVSTNTFGFQRRCTTSSTTSLESWAAPQAASPHQSTPLSTIPANTCTDSTETAVLIGRGW